MKIFHLDCSVNNFMNSYTRQQSRKIVSLLEANHDTEVHYIDLIETKIPYINKKYEKGMFKRAADRTPSEIEELNTFDLKPFIEADVYVLGVPAYFFNVPAIFKNWMEHIFRMDTTISPEWEGMLHNKKMYIVTAWGGDYANTTIEDTFEKVIRMTFNLFGITDITFFSIFTDKETNSNNLDVIEEEIEKTFK